MPCVGTRFDHKHNIQTHTPYPCSGKLPLLNAFAGASSSQPHGVRPDERMKAKRVQYVLDRRDILGMNVNIQIRDESISDWMNITTYIYRNER